jgi:hypothetical protein
MVQKITEENKREMTLMNALVLTDSNLTLEEKGLLALLNILGCEFDQLEIKDVIGYVQENEEQITRIYNSLLEKGY